MGSKGVLVLGIVILFLINVLAIHDYVNNHYYSVQTKKELKPIILKKEKKYSLAPKVDKKNKDLVDEDFLKYKASYKSNKVKEQNYTKKLMQKNLNQKKELKKGIEKVKVEKKDELELSSIMSLTFDVNHPYQKRSKMVKKLVSKVKKDKKIVIIIYQYSLKIQDYLKDIKDDLVDLGVDIDDISTIYKKNRDKKDKIKVLLVKKD